MREPPDRATSLPARGLAGRAVRRPILAAAGLGALVPCLLAAAAPPVDLRLQAPRECPGRDDLLAAVERLLGPAASSPWPGRAAVVIERAGRAGYRLRLSTESQGVTGRRTLEGTSCRALVDSAALVLALMIDPDAVSAQAASSLAPPPASALAPASPLASPEPSDAGAPATSTSPAASASPAVSAPPAAPMATAEPASPAEPAAGAAEATGRPAAVSTAPGASPDARPRLEVEAAAVAEAGGLPGVGVGARAGAGASWRRVRGGLAAAYWPGRTKELAGEPGVSGELSLWSASAEGCGRPAERWPWACVGVSVGRLSGQGAGVSEPRSGAGWLTSVLAGVRARWAVAGPLGVVAGAEGHLALERPEFALDGLGTLHRPARWQGRGWLGVQVVF